MSKCERWKRRDSNRRSWASRKADPPRFAQETRWIMRLCGSLRSKETATARHMPSDKHILCGLRGTPWQEGWEAAPG